MTSASPSLGRGDAERTARTADRFPDRALELVPLAAATAAAVLALTSTGSMVVAAALFGFAAGDRRSIAAALLAVAAVAVRFSTTGFDDLAGLQSVLGDAVEVGPATAAASAWLAGAALLLAVGVRPPDLRSRGAAAASSRWVDRATAAASALAAGAFAATVTFGQGPGGSLGVRIVATVVATAIAGSLVVLDHRMTRSVSNGRAWLGVAAGVAAVVLAAWP